MKKIIRLIPLFFVLSACNRYLDVDKEYILHNFTPEEINFFWETACYNDSEKEIRVKDDEFSVTKWKDDIHIRTYGELSHSDSIGIENAIKELNSLDLSIKAYWNSDTLNFHNYEIYFGEKSTLQQTFSEIVHGKYSIEENSEGFGYIQKNKGNFNKAFIGIVKKTGNERDVSFRLLHEFLNSLGLTGDSFSHIESVLYDSPLNNQTAFSEIDKAALRLLYSHAIHSGTNRTDFLNAFSSILHPRTITNDDYDAFESYIKKHKFSNETVQDFISIAFRIAAGNDEFHISKWKTRPVIRFESDSLERLFKNTLKVSVDSINTYLPEELKICFASSNQPYNVLVSRKDNWVEEMYAQTGIQNTSASIGNIRITNDEVLQKQEWIHILLVLWGVRPQIIGNATEPSAKKQTSEFIQLYLSPVVKSGMKKDKIIEILRKYYDLKTVNKIDYDALENYLSKKTLADSSMLYVKNQINQLIDSRPFTSKMEPGKIGLSAQVEKDSAIVRSLCQSLIPLVDICLVPSDLCNIFVDYFSESSGETYTFLDSSDQWIYTTIKIPVEYRISRQYNYFADYILSSIFTCSMETGVGRPIAKFDGANFTFEPYWFEALKFYYSPYIQSGMKKEKVMEIILKYYPESESVRRLCYVSKNAVNFSQLNIIPI